jgi:4-hydroxybenzoate polyprenyltransferase
VFTAFANVVAGVLLARQGRFELEDLSLVAASGLLYCAGMVLNDFFDRHVDAHERPQRPIPSGRVTAPGAAAFGGLLMVAGLTLCALSSPLAWQIGAGLAVAILLYDGGLKGTSLGPASMGACRLLNVMLGLSVVAEWTPWMWVAACTMGLYTAFITYLARDEVGGSSGQRARLGVSMLGSLFAVVLAALFIVGPAAHLGGLVAILPFVAYVVIRGRSLFGPLVRDSSGPALGRAIGGGILMMPAIDALMVAGAGYWKAGIVVFALALPAYRLKRMFYVT